MNVSKKTRKLIITKRIWREQRSAPSVLIIFEAARGFEEIELQHLRNQILEEYPIQKTTLCTSIAEHENNNEYRKKTEKERRQSTKNI